MTDQQVAELSASRRLLHGASSVVFVAMWIGVVCVQFTVALEAANSASHCSMSGGLWNSYVTENAAMALIVVAAAGTSGYLMCARRNGWGARALDRSINLCAILAVLIVYIASASALMLMEDSVANNPVSMPMTTIANALTAVTGLAAVNTLIVCRALRQSDTRPRAAAWRASLVPAVWYAVGCLVFAAAAAAYCS